MNVEEVRGYCLSKKGAMESFPFDDITLVVKVGDKAPDFKINEAGGKSYNLSDLKGKVVMLQFTASRCGVCRTEMPFIEKEILQEKKAAGLVVIGIDRMKKIIFAELATK